MSVVLRTWMAWLALSAGAASAQEQTATIDGTVRDPSGAAVAGATVSALGADGGRIETVTGERGLFRFVALPPGDYRLTARRAGFAPASPQEVTLSLGVALRVDLSLSNPVRSETLMVAGDAPLVDVRQSARFTTIRDERINLLPRGRDFLSLATQAPGTNPEPRLGGVSMDGASASENRYVIDGIDTAAVNTGLPGTRLVTDVVEEVQVKSTGYAAEYGGATGGVINVVTRRGTNVWTGAVGVYYGGDRLQSGPRPTLWLDPIDVTRTYYVTPPEDSFGRWEPGATVGGPLKRDALWVFGSYHPSFLTTRRSVSFLSTGQRRGFTQRVRTHNATVNVSGRIRRDTHFRMAFNAAPSTNTGVLPAIEGTGNPDDDYDSINHFQNRAITARFDRTAAAALSFSAGAGYWLTNVRDVGIHQGPGYRFIWSNIGMPGVPLDRQGVAGTHNVLNNWETTRDRYSRFGLHLDATARVSAAGAHVIKTGLQLDRVGNDVEAGHTGNWFLLSWGESFAGQTGTFGFYRVFGNGVVPGRGVLTYGNVHGENLSLFAQDSWTVRDRLTLQLGLRAERENVPSFTTEDGLAPVAISFRFEDKLAPRVGAAWDVRGDGAWRVYGSWGVFYDTMKYFLPRLAFGAMRTLDYWFTLDTPDWPNLARPGCPPACPGRLIQGPINNNLPANDRVVPGLQPFRLQERAVGIEHQVGGHVVVGARYQHRQLDRAVEDVGWLDAMGNQVFMFANPGFGPAAATPSGIPIPRAVREYDALELTVDRRMSRRWALHVSYLWSRLYGNYAGLSHSDQNTPVTPNWGRVFDHPMTVFGADGEPVYGVLATDRTHQVKAHVAYQLPFGTAVGTTARAATGVPLSRSALFFPGRAYQVFYAGRKSDGRTPALSQVDLYAQHEIRLGKKTRLQFSANVLNLLDRATAVNRYMAEWMDVIAISEADFFAGFAADEVASARGTRRDPRFGMDTAFQAPREIRLAARVVF